MAKAKTTEENQTTPDSQQDNGTMLEQILANQEKLMAENEMLKTQLGRKADINEDEDDDESTERKPAGEMLLATIDGMPIIDMRLEKLTERDKDGKTYMKGYQAKCKVHGSEKEVTLSYGDLESPNDFMNLTRTKFYLTDQDNSDLTGASHIERNKVVDNFGKVPEIDRSSGVPVRTGKMVNLVTKRDVRRYTIMVGDDKVELPEDKIYR